MAYAVIRCPGTKSQPYARKGRARVRAAETSDAILVASGFYGMATRTANAFVGGNPPGRIAERDNRPLRESGFSVVTLSVLNLASPTSTTQGVFRLNRGDIDGCGMASV